MASARHEGVSVEGARWAELLWRLSTDEKRRQWIKLWRDARGRR